MNLAEFIAHNTERIAAEWERFAATCVPAATSMTQAERRDHVTAMLDRIRVDIATPRTAADAGAGEETAAKSHGTSRAETGYTPDQMIAEFRALRACIARLWGADVVRFDRSTFDDLTRFNAAIDQALAESLGTYTAKVDHAKALFLGVLGHDLRTPLGAVMMGATIILAGEGTESVHAKTALQILRSGTRMDEIIRDLLDFTRAGLGGGIPVVLADLDLVPLVKQHIEEVGASHPRCSIELRSPRSLRGAWDGARLGQVLSNLLGNARQHGRDGAPIDVELTADADTAVIAVRNAGPVIEPRFLAEMFEPFRRRDPGPARSTSLGLGLYIAKAIVVAHRGTIGVASRDDATTFTVRIPRGRG